MIDNYLLEELVTFASEKTLAKTAENLTLPNRPLPGMQKLEDELGIQLFDRQPNRIVLTDTGKLAAEKLLKFSPSTVILFNNFKIMLLDNQ